MSEFYQERRTSIKDGVALVAFIAGWFGSAPFAWHHVSEGFDTGSPAVGVLKFLFFVFAAAIATGGIGLALGTVIGAGWERLHRRSRPESRDEFESAPPAPVTARRSTPPPATVRFASDGVTAADVLRLSAAVGYAERDEQRIGRALAQSVLVGAWENDVLIGFARILSDGNLSAALVDVIVDPAHQRRGIGRELVRRAFDLTPRGSLLIVAGKTSSAFFDHIGCERSGLGFAMTRPLRVALLLLAFVTARANAQDLRGVIRDSATGRPLASAVVIGLDSNGRGVARTLSNEGGRYFMARVRDAEAIQVLRLGYRPNKITLTDADRERGVLNVALATIPPLLEKVTVSASPNCPRRGDALHALALLQQARAGLLAIVVARDAHPSSMKRLAFVRTVVEDTDVIDHQEVRSDTVANTSTSFHAAQSAAEFAASGFSIDSGRFRMVYGPDADILLDDSFTLSYCFRIESGGRQRKDQIGLGFFPAARRGGRVDIEGALWIDTVANTLRDIDFRFLGLDKRGGPESTGRVRFQSMPNGVVFVANWDLNLVAQRLDTIVDYRGKQAVRQWPYFHQTGGAIARAEWADGPRWRQPLGTLRAHLLDRNDKPATNALLTLEGSSYIGTPDANGVVEITDLLPGPYSAFYVDTTADAVPVTIGANLNFVAKADSMVEVILRVPPQSDFRRAACLKKLKGGWTRVHVTSGGKALPGAQWELGYALGTPSREVIGKGLTDFQGEFGFCDILSPRRDFEVRVLLDDGIHNRTLALEDKPAEVFSARTKTRELFVEFP